MLSVGDHLDFKDGSYELTDEIHHGTNDLFRADHLAADGTRTGPFVVKVGPSAGDEPMTLAGVSRDVDPKFLPYLPTYVSTLLVDGDFGTVFQHLDGFYNLLEVKDHYPDGVNPKDMAWMFRRLLVVLGFTHQAGYIHGAVLPQHVMIHPEKHGLVLIDWSQAAWQGTDDLDGDEFAPIPASIGWYPHEAKVELHGPWTDIFMAANLMSWLMGGDAESVMLPRVIEREYRVFFNTLLHQDYRQRPRDAWYILENFDALIERMYGRRKFHPFHIPPQPIN